MKKLLLASVFVIASTPGTFAEAATFTAKSINCGDQPNCFVLKIEGKIELNDEKKFEELVKKNDVKTAVVSLNSPGGNLLAGYFIANMVRDAGYTTYTPDGTPKGGPGQCTSVCAMIWMAGAVRQVDARSRVGFHGAFAFDKKGKAAATSNGNALMGSFYARLGLSDPAIVYLTTAGPDEVKWLTDKVAKEYGIKVTELENNASFHVGPYHKPPQEAKVVPGATVVPSFKPSWTVPYVQLPPVTAKKFCVSVVEPPEEVRRDPEFVQYKWLSVREGPGRQYKEVSRTGAYGRIEADGTNGDWTHLVGRGWVLTKYIESCDGNA